MYGSFYDCDRSVTSMMRVSPELGVPISKDDFVHYVVSSRLSTYGDRISSSMIPLNRVGTSMTKLFSLSLTAD